MSSAPRCCTRLHESYWSIVGCGKFSILIGPLLPRDIGLSVLGRFVHKRYIHE